MTDRPMSMGPAARMRSTSSASSFSVVLEGWTLLKDL